MSSNQEDKTQDINIATISLDIKYIKEALAEIKATLRLMDDHYLSQKDADRLIKESDDIHRDFEKRIRANETFISNFKGKYAVIAAIVGLLLPAIVSMIVLRLQTPPEERAVQELKQIEERVEEIQTDLE